MFYTVDGEITGEFTVSHSRFITYLKGVETIQDGIDYQRSLKKKYPDATHVCLAVWAQDGQKAADDGEPAGTAGQPMLNVLKWQQLQAAAVTIRYFGGIKLGTGGLSAAYAKGVLTAISAAQVVCKVRCAILQIELGFKQYANLKNRCEGQKLLSESFSNAVTVVVAVPEDKLQSYLCALSEDTQGAAKYQIIEYRYESYPKGGLE